jgi:glucose uptake protein
MRIQFLIWLAGAMAIFLGAATASRAYISTSNILLLALSLALYCAGNLVMVRLMREGGLGLAISASAIAQLLFINIIAFAIFGEKLSLTQITGVGFGVVSMVLLLFPMDGKA